MIFELDLNLVYVNSSFSGSVPGAGETLRNETWSLSAFEELTA